MFLDVNPTVNNIPDFIEGSFLNDHNTKKKRNAEWDSKPLNPDGNYSKEIGCADGEKVVHKPEEVECDPKPDAFNPCEDVMGFPWLRVTVWMVMLTAFFGNLIVLVVTLSSRIKLTVPKFLMCHLAFSDLIMSLYLLMLGAFDLYSIHFYFIHAVQWQYNGGCQVAGFLAILSTCLSVFTLTVITLERWYAISHAIHLNKRLRLKKASIVMTGGWSYALLLAALPLLGISGYGKTSICLPMETKDGLSKAYVLFLLIINAIGFIIICGCYIDMYRQVRGKNSIAGRNNDASIAKRMAVLVFTDFICLSPIAFFGLTAAAGLPLITVTYSKILLVFFFPFNSCANPFLYAIFTKQFHKDLLSAFNRCGLCKKQAGKNRMIGYNKPISSQSRNLMNLHQSGGAQSSSLSVSFLSDVRRSSKASLNNTVFQSQLPPVTSKLTTVTRWHQTPAVKQPDPAAVISSKSRRRSSAETTHKTGESGNPRKLSVVRELSQHHAFEHSFDEIVPLRSPSHSRKPMERAKSHPDGLIKTNDRQITRANFHPVEVVSRDSETQLQVGENFT